MLLLSACSAPESGLEMQAGRALELQRNEEAYQLLLPPVKALLDSFPNDSTFAASIAADRRQHVARTHALFAHACLRTQRTPQGVRAASRAVLLGPNDPSAHFVKALLDQRRFRNVAALAAAQEAVRLSPADPRLRLALGELHWGGGMVGIPDYEKSLIEIREALRLDPKNSRIRYSLGKTLVLSGETEEGAAILDSLVTEQKAPAEARYLLGLARMRSRDFAAAEKEFEAATRLDPMNASAWFNRAKLLDLQGRPEEAAQVRARFDVAEQFAGNSRALEVTFHSNVEGAGAGVEWAALQLQAGRIRPALAVLESYVADYPEDRGAALLHARARLLGGDPARALELATPLLENPATRSGATNVSVDALLALDRNEEALQLARRGLEGGPPNVEAQMRLARALVAAGDAPGALRELQKARQMEPENFQVMGAIGVALARAEAWEEAEQALSAALVRVGLQPEWLRSRGKARAAMGRPGWAAEDFRLALQLDGADVSTYESLEAELRKMQKPGEADSVAEIAGRIRTSQEEIERLRAALQKDPNNVERAEHLARVMIEAGLVHAGEKILAETFEPGLEP